MANDVTVLADLLAPTLTPGEKPGKRLLALLEDLRDAPYDRDDFRQFLAFALGQARRSKGQLFQDLWALWVSGQKRGGFFVEFGAADGVNLSNTWLLETHMDWSGVLAEPNPRFFDSLAANRSCAVSTLCVHSVAGRTVEFISAKRGEVSRMAEIKPEDAQDESRLRGARMIEVQTTTLNDLLTDHQAPRVIDYMSVDVEGAELEILGAFDFDRWDVRAMSVEHNWSPAREPLMALMQANGYRRLWPELSRFDDWYVRD
jgi:FkbM family methyltransferase